MFQADGVEMQTIGNETFFMDAEGKSVFQLGHLTCSLIMRLDQYMYTGEVLVV